MEHAPEPGPIILHLTAPDLERLEAIRQAMAKEFDMNPLKLTLAAVIYTMVNESFESYERLYQVKKGNK